MYLLNREYHFTDNFTMMKRDEYHDETLFNFEVVFIALGWIIIYVYA